VRDDEQEVLGIAGDPPVGDHARGGVGEVDPLEAGPVVLDLVERLALAVYRPSAFCKVEAIVQGS
jgi:hypothetical protein